MRVKLACSVILSLSMHVVTTMPLLSQTLPLPPREADALSGSQVVAAIRSLPRDQREERLYQEIVSGNVPEFLRDLVPVAAQATVGSVQRTVTYYVAPDYLAVGSDEDYFLAPMTPLLAQRLADQLDCILPTRLMVNQIYAAAPCKLAPQPIPPSAEMTTVPVFALHDSIVGAQREENPAPLGTLVGGTKKDVVISNRIYQDLKPAVPHPVVIYGWHQLNGVPIQPLYNGHGETYADYSHGIRLVQEEILLDGAPGSLSALLQDAELWRLLSDEGPIAIPRYSIPTSTDVQSLDHHQTAPGVSVTRAIVGGGACGRNRLGSGRGCVESGPASVCLECSGTAQRGLLLQNGERHDSRPEFNHKDAPNAPPSVTGYCSDTARMRCLPDLQVLYSSRTRS
jgi:hypothetical protein